MGFIYIPYPYGGIGNPKQYISWGSVLNKLKVNNVADGVIAVPQGAMSAEGLLKINPDVIVITGQDWITPSSMKIGFNATEIGSQAILKKYLNRPGWSSLSAVKNKQVYSVWHNTAQITNFAAIESLAKDFYPDEFKDLNPENDLKEFYSKFMPIKYSGVWMLSLKK
ncbi:MAG TPA: ABC transporter substrate-binding protein [Clostridium sp.]